MAEENALVEFKVLESDPRLVVAIYAFINSSESFPSLFSRSQSFRAIIDIGLVEFIEGVCLMW
jgi:hypothetical protein